LAPQPSLGLGLLHKKWLNFLEASEQFSFYRVGLLALRPTPVPEDQTSVFISPRGRVATHFSRLLRHAWVTVVLFLFSGHPRHFFFHWLLQSLSDPWPSLMDFSIHRHLVGLLGWGISLTQTLIFN
jgi:hypothetical protein